MFASISRKGFLNWALLMVAAALLLSTTGCSAEARARRQLKRIVHKEIKQFNKYHRRIVKPNVYISGRRFYRTYKERIDHAVKMRSTKSTSTPFIATLNFIENTYLTEPRNSQKESRGDSHFVLSESKKREIVYAFVGGLWRRKEIY